MYSFDSRVRYSEVSRDGKLSLCSAVHYMQDCAIFHSESVGEGVRELKEESRVWLLSSWQIEVGRRPSLGERLNISTWACGFKAMYGYRNFVISGEGGGQDIRKGEAAREKAVEQRPGAPGCQLLGPDQAEQAAHDLAQGSQKPLAGIMHGQAQPNRRTNHIKNK